MMASLPALLLGASALLAGLAGGRGPAAAQQQCSSTSHCPAHQFCDHEATNSHCEPCTACAGCLCNLPAAGAANCRAACLAAPPGPPKHPTFPTLPKALTPTQLQVQRQAADIAAVATPAARPQVAALMGSPATNKYLRQFDDGSNLAALSGSELLGRFEAELDTVELVHNFGFPHPQSCGIDVTIASGPRAPDFYNQWVIQAAGIYPVDPNNNVFMEKTERDTFGFPPMADLGAPDLATAANRPVYAATNFYRDSAMNFQCGPVAAAFNREFIGAQALGFPVDSGNFGPTGCTANDAPFKPGLVEGNWSACFNCKDCVHEGLRPLGVPGNLTHFLLPYVHLYNVTMLAKDVQGQLVGADYPSYNLARLLTRMLSRKTYHMDSPTVKLNSFENYWGYFELNPIVTIPTSREGIKFMFADFGYFFGRPEGDQMRAWCIKKGWPLVWAHNPYVAASCSSVNGGHDPLYANCSSACWEVNGACQFNVGPTGGRAGAANPPPSCGTSCTQGHDDVAMRFLDPHVLVKVPEGHNSTRGAAFESARQVFETWWTTANATAKPSLPFPSRLILLTSIWEKMSAVLKTSPLAVEPLFAGACASQACIGVRVIDGTCLCAMA